MPVTPSNIRAWETALVDAVTAALPDLQVEPFPDRPQHWNFIHEVGAVLIRYHGGKFGKPNDTSQVMVQDRTPTFVLTVFSRNLRDHLGAYDILETLRQTLTGLDLPGCKGLYPLDENFTAQKDGEWVFEAMYAAHTWSVSALQFEEQGPNFQDLALERTT